MVQLITEFEEQWQNGAVEGWEGECQGNGHVRDLHAVIDLDYYSTVEELMVVGPEKLKEVYTILLEYLLLLIYLFH